MSKRIIYLILFLAFAGFMAHRFTRPLLFFEVSKSFERPEKVTVPEGLDSVRAEDCGLCHEEIYEEWKTTIHANAWKDPYFLVDYEFDGSMQICLNCHTPLENQQENLVLGFRDSASLDPILKPNPNFDPAFRDEGVTCAVCHIKDGVIVGPNGAGNDAHPVRKDERFSDGNSICKRCHSVQGDRWDVFLKLPPCGNYAEIEETGLPVDCVKCHMPKVKRAMAAGAEEKEGGKHLWRGGHDADTVRNAVKVELEEEKTGEAQVKRYAVSVTNIGAEHRIPTGTPDRHLRIYLGALDAKGNVIKKEESVLERVILWRPFIVDLWDTRLKFNETRRFEIEFEEGEAAFLEAEVRYGLLHESRRIQIGYENREPVTHKIFYKKISLN